MRRLLLIIFVVLISGCSTFTENSQSNESFKAYGKGEFWSVNTEHFFDGNKFLTAGKMSYFKEDEPENIRWEFIFPKDTSISYEGTVSKGKNIDLPKSGSSIISSKNENISYFKEKINRTVVEISWEINGIEQNEKIQLDIKN
jgi:hypothetical protein